MRNMIAIALAIALTLTPVTATEASTRMTEDEVYAIAEQVGEIYNISPDFLTALAFTESSFRPRVTAGSCCGLCQVSTKYHSGRMKKLGVTDVFDPYGNMLTAADYLAELFEEYGEASLVLSVYNGQSNAKQLYDEGRISKYAQKIFDYAYDLEERKGSMKQAKKLTLSQKQVCTNHGLIASQWMLISDGDVYIKVIHKDTGKIKILDKFRRKV